MPTSTASAASTESDDLFEQLRALRRTLADERGLPAYCVFPDAVLRALSDALPQDEDELSKIPGVGRKKLERYGDAFLGVLRGRR